MFRWDATNVGVHLETNQNNGYLAGNRLYQKMRRMPVLNANILDYLLEHPPLIPKQWKEKAVFFWGTIYRNREGRLCVRCLYWQGSGWSWRSNSIDRTWGARHPAAVDAS